MRKLLALAIGLLLLIPSTVLAFPNATIVDIARQYEGKNLGEVNGQCKQFVRIVVARAGGNLGIGYRFCYLDVGTEISSEEATKGDIIQLDAEKNHIESIDRSTDWRKSYTSPMHTAIIIENIGNGNFNVIDANYVSSYVVGVHQYNPWKESHGLHVHFYRLGTISQLPQSFQEKSEVNEKQQIEFEEKPIRESSKSFAEAWYNYPTKQNTKNFFKRVKPYMTDYLYNAEHDRILRVPEDLERQVPLQSHAISVEIISVLGDSAKSVVELYSFEPTTGRYYKHNVELTLVKQNSKWLINYFQ